MSEHKEPTPDEVIQKWFAYLDDEQERTVKLQKAASLARAGEHEEARRIKHAVDMSPRVFDGAYLLPAVKAVLKQRDEARALAAQRLRLLDDEETELFLEKGRRSEVEKQRDEARAEVERLKDDLDMYKESEVTFAEHNGQLLGEVERLRKELSGLIDACQEWDDAVKKVVQSEPRGDWLEPYRQALETQV